MTQCVQLSPWPVSVPLRNSSLTDLFGLVSSINSDVRSWTRSCIQCQRAKIQRHTATPLSPFPTPRFDIIHVDIVGPLLSSRGFTMCASLHLLVRSHSPLTLQQKLWHKHSSVDGSLILVYLPPLSQNMDNNLNPNSRPISCLFSVLSVLGLQLIILKLMAWLNVITDYLKLLSRLNPILMELSSRSPQHLSRSIRGHLLNSCKNSLVYTMLRLP